MIEDSKSGMESENKSIPLRENLVQTAVSFLTNPNVRNKPDHGKVTFLKNKGLTDLEISTAFERVLSEPGLSTVPKQSDFQHSFNSQPEPYYPKTYSFWSNLSSFSSSFIVIAVALYGLHRFYKLYIEPWLFGTKPEKDEIKELVKELNDSVLELRNSVATLEGSINCQKEQIDRVFLAEASPYMPIPMAVAELKSEIGNVKSLLINRHQFPSVPKVVSSPSIPLWQLQGKDEESKTEDELSENSSSPESKSPLKAVEENDKAEAENKPIDDQHDFDPAEPLLTVENGLNGVHDDSFDKSTSKIEDEE